jgi:hypothetical protein
MTGIRIMLWIAPSKKDSANAALEKRLWDAGAKRGSANRNCAAIGRVNRVFRDKPGGLVVDCLGLADQLKKALITYTENGGQGNPTFDTAQAIAVMLEKHGIACDLMHGFNWDKWTNGKPAERLALIPAGQEHIRLGERQRRCISQPSGCRVGEATLGNCPPDFSQP